MKSDSGAIQILVNAGSIHPIFHLSHWEDIVMTVMMADLIGGTLFFFFTPSLLFFSCKVQQQHREGTGAQRVEGAFIIVLVAMQLTNQPYS